MNSSVIQPNLGSAPVKRSATHPVVAVLRAWVWAYVALFAPRPGAVDTSTARLGSGFVG